MWCAMKKPQWNSGSFVVASKWQHRFINQPVCSQSEKNVTKMCPAISTIVCQGFLTILAQTVAFQDWARPMDFPLRIRQNFCYSVLLLFSHSLFLHHLLIDDSHTCDEIIPKCFKMRMQLSNRYLFDCVDVLGIEWYLILGHINVYKLE